MPTVAPPFFLTEVEGLPVHYTDRGSGSTVLLVHGFGGDLDNWLFNLEALAQVHRVVALDLPGHGKSDKRLPATTLPELAEWLSRFLTERELPRVHAVGHSLGGALVLKLAQQHPEQVQSLTLISSAGLGTEVNGSFLEGFIAASSVATLKPVVQQLFANPGLVSDSVVEAILAYKQQEGVTEALQQLESAVTALQAEGPPPSAPEQPTLVLWGQEDAILPVTHAQALPQAQVTVWEGAGHLVQMERAADLNERLLAFLATATSPEDQSA